MDWSRCIVHLYMLTCDLTSLVSLQFSHWLQVRKVGTFNSYSFIPSILMVLICLYFAQELWVVYFCLQITDIRQKLSKIRCIDALNLLWNTYFLWIHLLDKKNLSFIGAKLEKLKMLWLLRGRNGNLIKFASRTPWLPDLSCKHWFWSLVWNFLGHNADVWHEKCPSSEELAMRDCWEYYFAGCKHKKAIWKTSVCWLSYVLASSANDCPPNTPSLHHRCNLTLVNNICEAVLISLLWALNRLIKSPEVCFKFPFILIGKLIMASSTGQSWCITKSWNQSLVLSLTQQARRYDFL